MCSCVENCRPISGDVLHRGLYLAGPELCIQDCISVARGQANEDFLYVFNAMNNKRAQEEAVWSSQYMEDHMSYSVLGDCKSACVGYMVTVAGESLFINFCPLNLSSQV